MKRILILLSLAALLAAPSFAGIKACNTTLVNQGPCVTTDQEVIYLRLADANARANVAAALARSVGWTANVTCTAEMVTAGHCTEEQLGQPVTNPETRRAAASRALRLYVQGLVRSDLGEGHRATKNQELQVLLDGIETPAVEE
ncbi:MAG: hypothetical protein KJ058_10250 [Thermoanaerobaculia bacterium]|nr:hypothetical protein [Thermoanaerobaculia bacterium]